MLSKVKHFEFTKIAQSTYHHNQAGRRMLAAVALLLVGEVGVHLLRLVVEGAVGEP